jgi:hypothetical protein
VRGEQYMAEIYNFEEARQDKIFNERLTQKNRDFLASYDRVMHIEFPLSREWFGSREDSQSFVEQTSEQLFRTEENMKKFYGIILKKLPISDELPLREITFSNFPEYGDVTHKLARILFLQENGDKYDDLYQTSRQPTQI